MAQTKRDLHGRNTSRQITGMKNYLRSKLSKFYIYVFTAMLISACTINKKYHSSGFTVSGIFSSNPKNNPATTKPNTVKTKRAGTTVLQQASNKQAAFVIESTAEKFAPKTTQIHPNKDFKTNRKAHFLPRKIAQPTDTVYFPEKGKRHRQHRNIFIPHINYQEAFNLLALKAHNKDDKSWRMFDHAFQLGKFMLIWLVAAIGLLILIAALNLNLGGSSAIIIFLLQAILIFVPAILLVLGYLYFLIGTIALAAATATYKRAIKKLDPEFKLRGDAVVMHARIPFVSKAQTIKTGKRIIKQYPNNYYGEWLQDVSKTLTEIVTNRSDLTINNWKIVKTTGIVMSILLAIGLIAFIFV